MKYFRLPFSHILFLLSAALIVQSCDDNSFTGPDFSAAPPPYDRSEAVRDTTLAENLHIFVIEEGTGPFEVVSNDQVQVRYTGRTEDGEIFTTTYRPNSATDQSAILTNLTPNPSSNGASPPIEGLRKGLIGMREGEKRIIEVPPAMGYQSTPTVNRVMVQDKTLIYDVELVTIF